MQRKSLQESVDTVACPAGALTRCIPTQSEERRNFEIVVPNWCWVTRPTSPTESYCDGSCRGSQSDGAGMMERNDKAVGLRGQSGLDFHRQPDERICAMSDWTETRVA